MLLVCLCVSSVGAHYYPACKSETIISPHGNVNVFGLCVSNRLVDSNPIYMQDKVKYNLCMYSNTVCDTVLTWEQGEGDGVDAVLLGGGRALRVGDIHLEFDRLLENRRARRGFVFRSETRLRDHAVAQAGNLGGQKDRDRNKNRQREIRSNGIIDRGHWCLIFSRTPCNWQSE